MSVYEKNFEVKSGFSLIMALAMPRGFVFFVFQKDI